MGSLASVFNLATSSLSADQAALTVVSNNVANQNTVGYTREVSTFQSGATVELNGVVSSYGSPTVTVASQRDRVLEQRVQQQTQAEAASSSRSGVLNQIQDVFSLSVSSTTGSSVMAGSTQIGTAIDGFFRSLTALSANPADAATRQAVITAATAVASAANAGATQLAQIQTGVNSDLSSAVTAVNGLTSAIASLNLQIQEYKPGADAGTLEDQRQADIAQLSQYVGLDSITTESNGVTLTTIDGTALVLGSSSYGLTSAIVNGKTKIQDSTGKDVTGGITGGSIGGLLTAQSTDIPAVSTALDALVYRIATSVNTQNEAGRTTAGTAGAAVFSAPATAVGAAGSISVIAGGGALAAAGAGEGSTGNTNGLALAGIQQQTDSSGATVDQNLAALLSTIGSSASSTSELNTAQQATLTQLTSQRDSLSAVSLDEEAASLTQYQNSYNAAAKLFSIINTLYASALNLGVETTVA